MSRQRTPIDRQFGDFQTPDVLAESVMAAVVRTGVAPTTIIEPTCGQGALLLAALRAFPSAEQLLGFDINLDHLAVLRERAKHVPGAERIVARQSDFFATDWSAILATTRDPILVVGNPPWVTNAELGALDSRNVPVKSNFQGHKGFDALTGKSNFDISEWMLLRQLDWLRDRSGLMAVLVKTAVARKVLRQAWKGPNPPGSAFLVEIDAARHFGASVDACLFVVDNLDSAGPPSPHCFVYSDFTLKEASRHFGYEDGVLVSDLDAYRRLRHLRGGDSHFVWRSGVKHDSARIMEVEARGPEYVNGLGELFSLESTYLYPLLKSSDVASGRVTSPRKQVLITQRWVGEDTDAIAAEAPLTWRYLTSHQEALARRRSSIYKGKPAFSIFGIGDYAFAPWKVAISGFYKSLRFFPIGPVDGRPVMLDDTVNFVPCRSEEEATMIAHLLNSDPAQEFLRSMLFLDEKRPVTVDLLRRLNLRATARELGIEERFDTLPTVCASESTQPPLLV